jgi:DNA replication and repair protein RecF
VAVVKSLVINDVRCIGSASLSFSSGINIIDGDNGSGKTSVLESLHLLSSGRSFRNGSVQNLVRRGQQRSVVFGKLNAGGASQSIGVQVDSNGDKRYRLNGEYEQRASTISQLMPLVVINADSFNLASGSPAERRKFIDWGVFHVEHSFLEVWRRSQRALKQRNHLLRHGKIASESLDAWEQELVVAAEQVDRYRSNYFSQFTTSFTHLWDVLVERGDLPINLGYRRGWDSKEDYKQLLEAARTKDQERGFTHSGPHRADLSIKVDGLKASELLSRGQLKMLIVCLKLAQAETLFRIKGEKAAYLLDDLPAELDGDNRASVLSYLKRKGGQVFITAIDYRDLVIDLAEHKETALFHVEHGQIRVAA